MFSLWFWLVAIYWRGETIEVSERSTEDGEGLVCLCPIFG